jgi:small subunit ribosomal protein S20
MPNTKQAQKRLIQDQRRRLQNRGLASRMKTEMKRVLAHIDTKELDAAENALPEAFRRIDKAAKRRVIHRNAAGRKKSLLARKLNAARKGS